MMSSIARSYGFCGAIHGASSAAPTISTSIARPSVASLLAKKSPRKRRQVVCSRTGCAVAAAGAETGVVIGGYPVVRGGPAPYR